MLGSIKFSDDTKGPRRTRLDSRAPKPKVSLPGWVFYLSMLMETYTVVSFAWRIAVGAHNSFIIAITMTPPRLAIWYYTTLLLCRGSHREVWGMFFKADDIFLAASFAVVPYYYVQWIYPDGLAVWAAVAFTGVILTMNMVCRAHVQRYDFPHHHFLIYKTASRSGVNQTEVYVYLIFVSNTTLWLKVNVSLGSRMLKARKERENEARASAAADVALLSQPLSQPLLHDSVDDDVAVSKQQNPETGFDSDAL